MKSYLDRILPAVAALLFSFTSVAQVTTSSLSGRISDDNGVLPGAVVMAVYTPTGAMFHAVTDTKGYYSLGNITAGGPYELTVSCLGYMEMKVTDVNVALADNAVLDFNLQEAALSLDAVTVSAESRNSNMRSDRAGALTALNSKQIMN
ncbi:MAG: carboxypeptidase regulatory-like domain-containing protein, partial [Bacteroidales bacterium]|nr:carboxypeptidase regulatory-like domain-containing protein [Bacteroidales bacterium]